jgi:predicted secreted hydrolase
MRRAALAGLLAMVAILAAPAAIPQTPAADTPAAVVPGRPLVFPRDHGSHGEFRTEWWYVTGWLETGGRPIGFQVTFFRTRPTIDMRNPSAFTPRQLVIAHAAISDPRTGELLSAQRIARASLGLAGADESDARVWLSGWRLQRSGERWTTVIDGDEFGFELDFETTQPPLPNGEDGYSRKGPRPESASYYYSLPQLRVSGRLLRDGRPQTVTGTAWLDHEWSSEYLDAEASGWDWVGLNFDDGAALMAFRIRGRDGTARWAGATRREADGRTTVFGPDEVRFGPGRIWRSARTGTAYPVEWSLQVGATSHRITPLMDDQEHDTRASTGAIYWEGAVRVLTEGRPTGRGYLELTGYGTPLVLP